MKIKRKTKLFVGTLTWIGLDCLIWVLLGVNYAVIWAISGFFFLSFIEPYFKRK